MKRNTIQRKLTLEAVKRLHCHATAEEIYKEVRLDYPSLSRATVYRNLNELVECGEIGKLQVPGGAVHFDHLCHNHYHARCVKCGKLFDVDLAYMGDLTSGIKDLDGFIFSGYDLMFKGICHNCQSTEVASGEIGTNQVKSLQNNDSEIQIKPAKCCCNDIKDTKG